jgi:hypothetical protein
VPQFDDHIKQAKSNLSFLEIINQSAPIHFDWQVTACFYAALHLVNAHLANFGQQYRSHTDVKDVINPYNTTSVMKLTPDAYTAYESLFSLSRRARYLINKKDDNLFTDAPFFTHEKHLAKSIRHLEALCCYFDNLYTLNVPKMTVKCSFLKNKNEFQFFDIQ